MLEDLAPLATHILAVVIEEVRITTFDRLYGLGIQIDMLPTVFAKNKLLRLPNAR